MSPPVLQETIDVTYRPILTVLVYLVLALFAAAFPAMAWVRSQQGRQGHVSPSEIEGLAIRREPVDSLADARIRGAVVYRHYCQLCHGTGGKGDGANASLLEVKPRNFTDPEFWEKRTTEERLHDVVSRGGTHIGKSVLMPAWGRTLTEQEIRDVVVFVRDFAVQTEAPPE
ncbi:MAG: cytochrome c [Pirellulales bacterium]